MLSKIATRQFPLGLRQALYAARFVSVSKGMPRQQLNLARFSTKSVPDAEEVKADGTVKQQAIDDEVELDDDAVVNEEEVVDVAPESHKGSTVKHTFQAETRRILDIVANSLYTDKEVFLRELISNASDALEKARYLQTANHALPDADRELKIELSTNEKENTLTIQDYGIGMTKEELIENLGTIARSGSKAFVEATKHVEGGDTSNIIGQFGVGFYSVFMVCDKVEVYSMTSNKEQSQQAHYWTSTGSGDYELAEADGVTRGTKIILHLKESEKKYSIKHTLEGIVKKYSNFVGFPISLNGVKLNTVQALWTMDKSKITEEQHLDFYRYIANAYDTPSFRMQFTTDAPIEIKALFYFPERHMEKLGMGRSEPGVSLYCRKVLIQHKCKEILPEWLRFVKGVVDSEDIPLNISRENMQDSALIKRMSTVLTKRVIKFLAEQAKNDPKTYIKFWADFENFIKEGVCSDFVHKNDIAQLLRVDTSLGESQECSLDDYVARMSVEQTKIYYLCAPNRNFALSSPYFESFDKEGTEVIFLYSHIDDFVMKNLEKYNGRKLVSIESADMKELNKKEETEKTEEEKVKDEVAKKEAQTLVDYFTKVLGDKVSAVKATTRLSNSPAIVVDHESAAVRKMMSYVGSSNTSNISKQKLEINASHPTMVKLLKLKEKKPELAAMLVEQIFDNALIAADILDNPRTMLARLNKILEHATE